MKQSTNKIIIAGFPGVGKSKAAEILKGIVYDAESSDFHWIDDPEDGTKKKHPEWPKNYISHIKSLAYDTEGVKDYRDLVYICCSTHEEILRYLRDDRVPFVIAIPEDKENTITRYRARGNSEAFVKKLEENWDAWMANFESYDMPIIRLSSDMYLSDLLDKLSTYDYLIDKINDVNKYVLSLEEDE